MKARLLSHIAASRVRAAWFDAERGMPASLLRSAQTERLVAEFDRGSAPPQGPT